MIILIMSSLSPTQFFSACILIIIGAYGTCFYNQHLAQTSLEFVKVNVDPLKMILEDSEELEQIPWNKMKTDIKRMKCMSRRPAPPGRKMTCEEFANEEIASEAAMWEYIRVHHGQHRAPPPSPDLCAIRYF